MIINEFKYNQKPIGSLKGLAKLLSLSEQELITLANSSDKYYKVAEKVPKKDGSYRITYKVVYPLSKALKTIRQRVFNFVDMPEFIVAGRPGKSYIKNALIHNSSVMIVSEDISKFFDSIKQKYIQILFQHFFCFPPDVSEILAKLCTLKGFLMQGSTLSGDIANLLFYDKEPEIVNKIDKLGLTYTRYYDDIYVSSKDDGFDEHISVIKSAIYGMFKSVELLPNRSPDKSRVMRQSSRMDVHGVTVNSHKISPSKSRVSNVRLQLKIFKDSVSNNEEIEGLITLYKSTYGHILTLKAQGSQRHLKMLYELNQIVQSVDEASAKRYARGFRKLKTMKNYKKFSNRVSVLKKINFKLAGVINAEAKEAKHRIKNRR